MWNSLRKILFVTNFLLITFIGKQVISWIPNVQVVVLLMAVFAAQSNTKEIIYFMLGYVVLDFIAWGYPTLMIPSFIFGTVWMLFVKESKLNSFQLGISTIPLTFFHILVYLLHDIILGLPLDFIPFYLVAGIPFSIMFLLSSMFSLWYLYNPLDKVLKEVLWKIQY